MEKSVAPSSTLQMSNAFLLRYRTVYNSLQDVETAYDTLLARKDRLKVIREALRILKKHKTNEYTGIFLLHRHFDCKARTIFVERSYKPESEGHRALFITTAEPIENSPKRMAPFRFKISKKGDLQPLEFTTDTAAIKSFASFSNAGAMHRELGAYFEDKGLSDLLGVGIHSRSRAIEETTLVFVEETRFDDLASLTHLVNHVPAQIRRSIPTHWTLRATTRNGCCTYNCVAYCTNHANPGSGYCGHRKENHVGCV
ncbi:MAG TPA: hypothetical protein VGW58_08220 [Pyrinomonadaceae bacterium]|nr:hypothetical protein [Pyrinomonadaceae bacterium]